MYVLYQENTRIASLLTSTNKKGTMTGPFVYWQLLSYLCHFNFFFAFVKSIYAYTDIKAAGRDMKKARARLEKLGRLNVSSWLRSEVTTKIRTCSIYAPEPRYKHAKAIGHVML